jgi:hypothetical protein
LNVATASENSARATSIVRVEPKRRSLKKLTTWKVIEKETRIIILEPRKECAEKTVEFHVQVPKSGKQRLTVQITNEIEEA